MPGTGAIRWGDISFRTRPRPPTEPPILTRRTRGQRPDTTGVEGTGGTGGHGPRCRWAAGPGHTHARPETTAGPAGQQECGCGARGRRRGLAGQRDDAFNHTSASQAPLVWRAPEGPEGLAAAPVGGGGAWPDNETTRSATHQRPSPTGVKGAGGSGGHGRASRRGAERREALASRAAGPSGARNTSGATSTATGKGKPTAPGMP